MHSRLEPGQLNLVQCTFIDLRADGFPLGFLIVRREVFDRRDDALRLDRGDFHAHDLRREKWIFAERLKISSRLRYADDVDHWRQ